MTSVDLFVIGAGQAAAPLLAAARAHGASVRIAERDRVGGACVNWGCTPTKAVLASARLLGDLRRADRFGIVVDGFRIDPAAVYARARELVESSRRSAEAELGDDLVRGDARIVGRSDDGWRVSVGEAEFLARDVVLNVGATSALPTIDGLHDPLTAENWLDRAESPASLAMLGGGYVSLEMAHHYRSLGSEVTIVERGDALLEREIPAIRDAVRECLEAEGIRVLLGTEVTAIRDRRLVGTDVVADRLFVATGRRPNLPLDGLDGLAVDEHGYAIVDDRLRTNLPNLWATGDVRGGAMFTHRAWDDGRVVAANLFATGDRATAATLVPYAVFTDPPLGRVGEMEGEIAEFAVEKNGAAQAERAESGRVWVAHREGRIVGAAVHAEHGADLVQFFLPFVHQGLPVRLLRDLLTIHPTFTEALQSAVL